MIPIWKNPFWILVGTQLLFTLGDLIARSHMKTGGFTIANLCTGWFVLYFLIRLVATFGQLFVFAAFELGRSMALFGAASIVLSNLLGFLVLQEALAPLTYVGIVLAVLAFLVLAAS